MKNELLFWQFYEEIEELVEEGDKLTPLESKPFPMFLVTTEKLLRGRSYFFNILVALINDEFRVTTEVSYRKLGEFGILMLKFRIEEGGIGVAKSKDLSQFKRSLIDLIVTGKWNM